MTPDQIAMVQHSFSKVTPIADVAAGLFYGKLFEIAPDTRAMFKGDMAEQRRKLLAALALVVRSLHAPEKIIEPVKNLAVKHVGYGVEPVHYTYVGNALLRTLKKGLGEKFTPELRDAWVEAYATLAEIMKEAAYGGRNGLIDTIRKTG